MKGMKMGPGPSNFEVKSSHRPETKRGGERMEDEDEDDEDEDGDQEVVVVSNLV